ncbi:MAG: hypothetical protein GY868_14035 [Deltaproteobacteria bacterium]|nr:hypothetical protein [Deltaproteobacteria bacterium]
MIHNARGDSKLGCLIMLAAAAAVIYTGFQWGYAQWDYETMREELTHVIRSAAKDAARGGLKHENVITRIIQIADQKTDIDLYEDDIEITVTENDVAIDVYWDVPIPFPGYTYYLEYTVSKRRKKR